MKSLLEKNTPEIYNERKSVVVEGFIKIYKYMTSISKNVYIDKLYDIVNKYK